MLLYDKTGGIPGFGYSTPLTMIKREKAGGAARDGTLVKLSTS